MEFDLHPTVTLRTGTFSAVVAPEDAVLAGINDNPVLQRFLFLFVSGNYSRLLPGINRRSVNIEVRRAFTAYQLLHILQESYHTIVWVEHDPSLYEDAAEMAVQVGAGLRQLGQGSLVVLSTPAPDPHFEEMSRMADRAFYLASPLAPLPRPRAKGRGKVRFPAGLPRGQTTLEGT
jgi:DNA polymerase I